jgi:hypothetical protein
MLKLNLAKNGRLIKVLAMKSVIHGTKEVFYTEFKIMRLCVKNMHGCYK